MAEIQDNRYGYYSRGDAGMQQKIFGTTEMAKWVGRTMTDGQISTRNEYQPEGVSLLL